MVRERGTGEQTETTRRAWRGRSIAYHGGFAALVLVAIGLLGALRVADPYVVETARATAFDLLQRAAPRSYIDAPIRIVDIDERALEELGQWPWPRDRMAEMVDRLHAAGAAVVAFDVLFVEPDRMSPSRLMQDPEVRSRLGLAETSAEADLPDNDRIFADAIERGNVVLGFGTSPKLEGVPEVKAGFAYTGEDPAGYVARLQGGARVLPVLAEAAAGLGSVNISDDFSIGTVRQTPLLWGDGARLYPSLVGEALRVAQGAQTYVVHADADGGVQSLRIGAFEVPTQPSGELYLHYTPSRADRYVSAADVFDDEGLREIAPLLRGRIVLVGTSAAGLFDLHKTPLGESVPGVEMHAQAIEQIINQQFLLRHDWTRGVELLAMVLACLVVSATTMYGGARLSFLVGGGVSALIGYAVWHAFRHEGVLLDFSFPLAGGLAVWFVATGFRYIVADREKREIRNAFSHYVHPTILKEIERNYSQVRLGGENCELTVMFTDVRGFTPLSERLTPEALVAFLNNLLGRLGAEITHEKGVIDKYIGDSVMAFWNAPLRQPDHAKRACLAALKMRAAMREMAATNAFGLPEDIARDRPVEIGVGINTGPACVGNVGSAERFDYSAIGDAVNISARAEAACKELAYDLVVARSTAELAPDLAFLDAGAVPLKGKTEPVALAILVGDETMNASQQFTEFAGHYRALIEALRHGRAQAVEQAMQDCRRLAAELEPGLGRYLERVPERRADFAAEHDPQEALVEAE